MNDKKVSGQKSDFGVSFYNRYKNDTEILDVDFKHSCVVAQVYIANSIN